MESKVCKGKLYMYGTCYVHGRRHVGEVYFLANDIYKLDNLLGKNDLGRCVNHEVIHLPMILPGPLEFCKTQDFQFIFRLSDKEYQFEDLNLKLPGAIQETIYGGGEIYELLTNDNKFFTSKLLPEPVYSSKVKAISEMERIEKLLKEADLQLSPEQEVKLLRKIVEEQQAIINKLQGN